jgi:hypothetical protein
LDFVLGYPDLIDQFWLTETEGPAPTKTRRLSPCDGLILNVCYQSVPGIRF